MVIPCLPNRKEPATARQQPGNNTNYRHSFNGNELHAFDLTWRNYLPSISQFFCCLNKGQHGNIRLDDDDPLIEPAYYNDHTLYRGEALQNYLDNPRDWEFESVLNGGNNNDFPQFVTRNPFGTKSIKGKKKKLKHKKKNRGHGGPVVMETDLEEGYITGYDIEDNQYCEQEEGQQEYYHDDAEFLGDDQIANLAYNRHSSQVMDQYGEELYYQHIQGPIIQEMQAPPPQDPPQAREFYAAKTMPDLNFMNDLVDEENYDGYEETIVQQQEPSSSTKKPQASIEAAQALLSEKLDDLTEKLAFIKNNIIHIQPPSKTKDITAQDDDDDEYDRNTLRTVKRHDEDEEEQQHDHKNSNTPSSSDLDSITSEALDVYENTTTTYPQQQQHQQSSTRRYSSGDELHLPSLVDNTPFVSDQHPFTYFTEQSASSHNHQEEEEDEEESKTALNVRNVLDLGRKWFFSSSNTTD